MSHVTKSRNSLEELIMLLVEKDTSWDASINSQVVEHSFEILSQKREDKTPKKVQLASTRRAMKFLAIKSNIEEIVKTILNFQPQALKHTDKEGMNI